MCVFLVLAHPVVSDKGPLNNCGLLLLLYNEIVLVNVVGLQCTCLAEVPMQFSYFCTATLTQSNSRKLSVTMKKSVRWRSLVVRLTLTIQMFSSNHSGL